MIAHVWHSMRPWRSCGMSMATALQPITLPDIATRITIINITGINNIIASIGTRGTTN